MSKNTNKSTLQVTIITAIIAIFSLLSYFDQKQNLSQKIVSTTQPFYSDIFLKTIFYSSPIIIATGFIYLLIVGINNSETITKKWLKTESSLYDLTITLLIILLGFTATLLFGLHILITIQFQPLGIILFWCEMISSTIILIIITSTIMYPHTKEFGNHIGTQINKIKRDVK